MTLTRTPIARTGTLKRSGPLKRKTGIGRAKTLLKSTRPKMTPIRKAARGQECTLQILGVCNGQPDTVVLCHSNKLADGKGMGLKAADEKAAFGCSSCHDVLDGRAPRPAGMTAEQVDTYFRLAVQRTHAILRSKGLMP
ncbi:MAG: nuclease domain-containing protein [Janthinobacterium lividum]